MAFDLYLAGGQSKEVEKVLKENKCCRLFSQLNDRRHIIKMCNELEAEGKDQKLLVDSGAFSAWSRGVELDVDEYIEFLNNYSKCIDLFACIDNIPGERTRKPTIEEKMQSPQLTWENYLYMRERINEKDKLVPTFHVGEDISHLQNILNTKLDGKHIPYIALGGTVGLAVGYKQKWYSKTFKIIKESKNPNVKVHAFGMTSLKVLESYPFTSADSTSWIMTGANGGIYTDNGIVKVSEKSMDNPAYIGKLSIERQKLIERQLIEAGVTLEQCREDGNASAIDNAMFLKKWADNYKYKGNNRYQKTLF